MKLLTKDQILQADDRGFKDVDVPEWGGTVRLMAMSAAERDSFEAGMLDNKGKSDSKKLLNFRSKFIASCIVGENGERLFSAGDVVALGKKSSAPISRLFDLCRVLNGMDEETAEQLTGE